MVGCFNSLMGYRSSLVQISPWDLPVLWVSEDSNVMHCVEICFAFVDEKWCYSDVCYCDAPDTIERRPDANLYKYMRREMATENGELICMLPTRHSARHTSLPTPFPVKSIRLLVLFPPPHVIASPAHTRASIISSPLISHPDPIPIPIPIPLASLYFRLSNLRAFSF